LADRSGEPAKQMPPRVRASSGASRPRACGGAGRCHAVAIHEQERAGLDIITDGEQRRESHSNRFATALAGVDSDNSGRTPNRTGGFAIVPRIVGEVRRLQPVEVRDVEFLRANTTRMVKMTVPGPSPWRSSAWMNSTATRRRWRSIRRGRQCRDQGPVAAGADVVQLDEPWPQAR
jgi:5-methyltetrahydropteroyltriglutamate--homocysteine methyltransferase